MSSVLRAFVERIVTDPGFRKVFITKPKDVLDSQAISPSERRALLRARRRLLLAGSGGELGFDPFEWP